MEQVFYILLILTSIIGLAFITGAFCSALSGYFGMRVATRANVRTAAAARRGLAPALVIAFRGGAVMGSDKLFQHYLRDLMGMRNQPIAIYENQAGLYATTLFGAPLELPFTKAHIGCIL